MHLDSILAPSRSGGGAHAESRPLRLADRPSSSPGAAWGPDNTLVITTGWLHGLSTVSTEGGELRPITTPDASKGEKGHWWPHFLPDGRHVLFTIWRAATGLNDAEIAVLDLSTGQYHTVIRGADGWYVDPGVLVFFRAGAYQAVRFDPRTLATAGEPVTVLTDDRGNTPDGASATLSLSTSGTLAYVPGAYSPEATLA